jgi:hypothetical protein
MQMVARSIIAEVVTEVPPPSEFQQFVNARIALYQCYGGAVSGILVKLLTSSGEGRRIDCAASPSPH